MFRRWKQHWCEFRRGRPGHRFQERFERNQQSRSTRSRFTRFLKPILGIFLLAAGLVFCVIPGPGLPFVIIGAGLLADVSRPVARVLDWLEVCIRNAIAWGCRWWNQASRTAKNVAIVLGVFVASGAAYGGFRLVVASVN